MFEKKKSGDRKWSFTYWSDLVIKRFLIVGSWSCLVEIYNPVHLQLPSNNHITLFIYLFNFDATILMIIILVDEERRKC